MILSSIRPVSLRAVKQAQSPAKTKIAIRTPLLQRKEERAGLTHALFDYNTLSAEAYYIGKGIILFTMFYCTMNWWHYRQLRKDSEKQDNNKSN